MPASTMTTPASWSPTGKTEWFTPAAYAALTRAFAAAVADTGVNFQLNDGGRTKAEQIALFEANYRDTDRTHKTKSTDRWYDGTVWARRSGSVAVASPDLFGTGTGANHTKGLAADIGPAGDMPTWFQTKGSPYGFSWAEGKRNNESWHLVYVPSMDRYRSWGVLDHAWVQKVVGAKVDGKIGTGTVELIKAWQSDHGLTADGKVGPKTKAAMAGGALADVVEVVEDAVSEAVNEAAVKSAGGFTYTYLREDWDTQGIASSVHPYNADVFGVFIHYPGADEALTGFTDEQVAERLRAYRKDHVQRNGWKDIGYGVVVAPSGSAFQGRGLDMEVSSNGGSETNSGAGSIMFFVGNDEELTPEQIVTGNALLAQYGKVYGEGRLLGHRESWEASTACPGTRVMAAIREGTLHWGSGSAAVPTGSAQEKLTAASGDLKVDGRFGTSTVKALQRWLNEKHGAGLKVDGKAGAKTWRALQEALGTPVDGAVSAQSYKPSELGNGITQGWQYAGRGAKGSTMVRALQKLIGVKADGIVGPNTVKALQRYLNGQS